MEIEVHDEQGNRDFKVVFSFFSCTSFFPTCAYLFSTFFHVSLPDRFDSSIFRFESEMLYVSDVPAFLIIYALSGSLKTYIVTGMLISWPIWLISAKLPSDVDTSPINPQFFLAPTMTLVGIVAGFLVFTIANCNWGR